MKHVAFAEKLVDDIIQTDAHILDIFIEIEKTRTRVAANSMAINQDAINAIRKGDGSEILKVFGTALDQYPIDFFIVCDANGKVLARTNQPYSSSASMLDVQGIRDALYGKTSTYFESDQLVKLSLITSVPFFGTHGTVTAVISGGVMLDSTKTATSLRQLLKTDGTLFVGNDIAAQMPSEKYTGAMAMALFSETKPLLEKGEDYYGESSIGGESFKIFCKPVMNAKNEQIATMLLFSKSSEIASQLRSLVWVGVLVAAVGVALSKGLMFLLLASLSRRLRRMARSAEYVANGKLNVSFPSNSKDEAGALGRSLQKATDKIAKLFSEIFHLISEYKKGNISFQLVLEDFRGQYEALADSILSLTNMSIKDRRTGLPNRRTLYSRLILVRERAIKENSPLSILLVDIDRFKQFGIDMGDAVLRKAAQMMSISIIADVDMVARWAGDIFIVLLPNTAKDGALHVAERIMGRIENCVVEGSSESETIKMTVSIGAYTIIPTPGDTPDSMIVRANEALYSTKGKGGNQLALIEGTHAPEIP
jgi:diguanylate cyclase (GGDEF)-like protein